MADDFEMSELWPIGEIADHLPRLPGGSAHSITGKVYRWLNLSNDQTRKTLRSVQIGRYRYTCDRWLKDFLSGASPAVPTATIGQRERRRAKVKAELAKAGI